jgi:dihydrofolate reductase
MRVNLIYARARNGVIGRDNTLPWHLPEDLAHFKHATAGLPVIMGRKTWDSLPARFRPLPGRTNLVVTRQSGWRADGALPASGVQHALQLCAALSPAPADVWIIGGAQLYASALTMAQRAVVTELAQDVEGDTFAPLLDAQWHETSRDEQVSRNGMRFAFVTYHKRKNPQGTIDV